MNDTEYIMRKCIPSKESGTHQLMQGTLPSPYDPDTKTYRASPETLAQAEDLESRLDTLPASLLNRDLSALQIP